MKVASANLARQFARLPLIQDAYGLPRSRIYELLSKGAIRAKKDGRALLIEVASVDEYVRALPEAAIRCSSAVASN